MRHGSSRSMAGLTWRPAFGSGWETRMDAEMGTPWWWRRRISTGGPAHIGRNGDGNPTSEALRLVERIRLSDAETRRIWTPLSSVRTKPRFNPSYERRWFTFVASWLSAAGASTGQGSAQRSAGGGVALTRAEAGRHSASWVSVSFHSHSARRHGVRLQAYLRPLEGARTAPGHDGKCARGCQSLVRPCLASPCRRRIPAPV